MNLSDPSSWTIASARAALDRRDVSASELARCVLDRIARDRAGACTRFLDRHAASARSADAAAADARLARGERGPLARHPGRAQGHHRDRAASRTTCGSRILEGFVPPYDATRPSACARRRVLRRQGQLRRVRDGLVERELGLRRRRATRGTSTRVPGGSSGGSAAAVAARPVRSARSAPTPAARSASRRRYCGVVGLKPTYGRVSPLRRDRLRVVARPGRAARARRGRRARIVLGVIAGHDPRDSTSVPRPVPDYAAALARRRARAAHRPAARVLRRGHATRRSSAAVRAAVATLASARRRRSTTVSLPHTEYAVATYYLIATAEASLEPRALRRRPLRPARRRRRAACSTCTAQTRGAGFGAEVKRRIMLGTYALSAGYYDAYYLKAQQVRTLIRRDFEQRLRDAATCIVDADRADHRVPARREDRRPAADVPLRHLHDLGEPGRPARRSSLPCGFDAAGLPIGLQIVGRPFGEETVLRVGARLRAGDRLAPPRRARAPPERSAARDAASATTRAVIGLEVHAELLTASKIFCGCSAAFGAPPNEHTCPVCLGMPGVLPVLNRRVVEFAIRAGLATALRHRAASAAGRARTTSTPTCPRATRSASTSCRSATAGGVDIEVDGAAKRVRLTRIHMEEDTGKNIHDAHGDASLVDFNRAGVPLLEIVSEPDMPLAGRGGRLPAHAARDPAVPRDLRRQHGGRQLPLRRQRLGAAARRDHARHQGRDQEHELLPRRRARDRLRDRAPDRACSSDGGASCRRRGSGTPTARRRASMRARSRRTTTATSPSPTCCRSVVADAWVDEVRRALPELPDARRARFVARLRPSRRTTPRC